MRELMLCVRVAVPESTTPEQLNEALLYELGRADYSSENPAIVEGFEVTEIQHS